MPDSLRGSSNKIGTIRGRLAWPLRKDDTHKSSVKYQVFYAVDICLVVFCDSKISTAHARLACKQAQARQNYAVSVALQHQQRMTQSKTVCPEFVAREKRLQQIRKKQWVDMRPCWTTLFSESPSLLCLPNSVCCPAEFGFRAL